MNDLTKLPNIGAVLAQNLMRADIHTPYELRELGSKQAFFKVKMLYPDACLNHLYALEGAVRGIRWHGLSKETKEDLKSFFNSL